MILYGIFKYKLRKGKDMKLKTAITKLRKEAEFLGMTFDEVLIFIERNPFAVKNSTIDAFAVWRKEIDWCVEEAMKEIDSDRSLAKAIKAGAV
tara:strand:- start:389 stop:667 length:279 start_codon:yes stop_codon:yes gene_type:complete